MGTKELKALKVAELKELVASKKLQAGLKEEMIETVLAHEARVREVARVREAKVCEVVSKKRQELAAKSNPDLKEMLEAKSLKLGGSKEERVERLLSQWQERGEVEKILRIMAQDARREELNSMEKAVLKEICDKAGIDVLVKEVLVERILAHEMQSA